MTATTTPHWPSVGLGYDAADDQVARMHRRALGYDASDDAYARRGGVGYDAADDAVARGVGYDRADDAYARTGMGDGSSDLATFDATMGVADTAFNAGDWPTAVSTYQGAGQAGAQVVGPSIDVSTGNNSVALTQQAWAINSNLQAVNSNNASQSDALSAQGYARQMQNIYHQAIMATTQPGGTMSAPSAALTTAAQAVVAYINANGCSQASLPVVTTFQGQYNNEGQILLTVDGKYGPNTQMAVQRVLGQSPKDCFTGVAPVTPGGGGGGKVVVPTTNIVGSPSSNLKWWLIGGGVVAGGAGIAYAVHKRRKARRR